MMRINLLGGPKGPPPVVGPPPTTGRQAFILLGALGVCAVVIVFFHWVWSSEISRLNADIEIQRREAERLRQIREENQKYVQRRQQLEQRINTIQMLQAGRVGPAQFMNALGLTATLRPDVYLLSVAPEGNRVAIRGQANTVESIAEFVAAIKRSGNFADVQLRQYFQDDDQNRVSYKFNLDCVYKLPTPPQPAGQQAQQRQPGAPGGAAPPRPAGF